MEKKKSDYAVMMESQKFYVLSNTNLFYLLNVYEFAVFNQIIHINDIDMNYASLNFLSELMNLSKNTVKKAVERLVALQMIERKRSLNGTYCYTLNVSKIEEIYNSVNSYRKIEDRKRYCEEYAASCGVPRNDTRVSRDGTRVPSDGSRVSRDGTRGVSRDGTHIKNIYKKDDLNNKDNSIGSISETSIKAVLGEDGINLVNSQNNIVFTLPKDGSVLISQNTLDNQLIKVEKDRYRDYIRLVSKNNEIFVINHVNLENYLYGVVPAEMPATFHIEALKAQAVASRS